MMHNLDENIVKIVNHREIKQRFEKNVIQKMLCTEIIKLLWCRLEEW